MKVGVFIDAANITMNGGYAMRYDVLRNFCSFGHDVVRLNTYLAYDGDRIRNDEEYRIRQYRYYSVLRNFGYKVITKEVRWYNDDQGNRLGKANADLDMGIDMLLQAKFLDKIYLLTGDGGFRKVVGALQNQGVRVELIAFNNVSKELKFESDRFTSGFIIPNLLPFEHERTNRPNQENLWGEEGSLVRGICHNPADSYAFVRIMGKDYRPKDVFCHVADSHDIHAFVMDRVYEFTLTHSDQGLQGKNIRLVDQ
ncbi:MAG: NYN domain-containing protein [Salibacteraceae bacterium]